MSSRRLAQVQDLIAQELGAILLKELEFPSGSFPNILRVKVAPDLKNATVWLGVFPPEKRVQVLKLINTHIGEIQNLLNKRLVMKFVPRLLFKIDTTSDHVSRINELVAEIKSENESSK